MLLTFAAPAALFNVNEEDVNDQEGHGVGV